MLPLFSRFRFFCLLSGFLALPLFLTGCEGVASVGESLSQLRLPSLSSPGGKDSKDLAEMGSASPPAPLSGIVAQTGPECPSVKVPPELSRLSQYADPEKPVPEGLLAEVTLNNVAVMCRVGKSSVTLDLAFTFSGRLGPQGIKDTVVESNYSYPYFLTVVDAGGGIIAKDVFAISMTYGKGQTETGREDRLRQTIPLPEGTPANAFQVLAGFQLSEEELDYNRLASQAAKQTQDLPLEKKK